MAPGTYYTAADVEPFWRLDNKFMEKVRLRGTLGYIVKNKIGPLSSSTTLSGRAQKASLKTMSATSGV